jgi:hypothetical protein
MEGREGRLSGFRRMLVAGSLALLMTGAQAQPRAQNDDTPPAPPTSRGENFSARPAAHVFQSDCTGSGCHSSPRGLVKRYSAGSLAGFLREHYTNSRESAAALAGYLISSGAAPPPERSARPQPPSAPVRPPRAVGREEPSEPPQAGARASVRRGRQVATPLPEPAPPQPSEPTPVAAPPKPPPKPKQFDIFD